MTRLHRHAALRWIGVALFIAAIPAASVLLFHVATGKSPLGHAMNCMLALGLSLGAFGTNNDTAVHTMRELARSGQLPPAFAKELAREKAVRAAGLAEIHASVKAGMVFPLLAAAGVLWLYFRAGIFG
jgi:hypothetical protein